MADEAPSSKPSGYAHRVVHLDSIEEALAQMPKRPQGRPRRQLRDFAIRQLRRAEKYQRRLDRAMRDAKKGEAIDPVLIQCVQTAKSITDTMMNAIEQVRRSDKAEREKMGGLTGEQLDAVLINELPRIAPKMDDRMWRELLAAKWGEQVADLLLQTPSRAVAEAEVPA